MRWIPGGLMTAGKTGLKIWRTNTEGPQIVQRLGMRGPRNANNGAEQNGQQKPNGRKATPLGACGKTKA
jgi:hypothetical protein